MQPSVSDRLSVQENGVYTYLRNVGDFAVSFDCVNTNCLKIVGCLSVLS
jgi:hypothetical protein